MREIVASALIALFEWIMTVSLGLIGYGVKRVEVTIGDCFCVNVEVKNEDK